MSLDTIPEIIEDIRAGKMVILMDDEDRENEGDIIMAATHVRPEDINFMITHARGLVCLNLAPTLPCQLKQLKVSPRVSLRPIARALFKQRSHLQQNLKTSYNLGISSRSWHKTAAYCTVPDIPKQGAT
jgi:3,4-dihydroxy-2-butanone 4-phosphate synthase